jgi:aspartate carbamoyltransferase catalytic subunit
MPEYIIDEYEENNIEYHIMDRMEDVIPEVDILYMTRVQKERFDETEYRHIRAKYILTPELLEDAKPNLKVLHPLPRIDEITAEVDKTPYAYYFQQAANGVYARQALLSLVLNEEV